MRGLIANPIECYAFKCNQVGLLNRPGRQNGVVAAGASLHRPWTSAGSATPTSLHHEDQVPGSATILRQFPDTLATGAGYHYSRDSARRERQAIQIAFILPALRRRASLSIPLFYRNKGE